MNPVAIGPADFGALMQSLKYCVLLHDARTYDILWANRAACELLGQARRRAQAAQGTGHEQERPPVQP